MLQTPIDLSAATKLKEAYLTCNRNPEWIVKTLRTITRNHESLERISLKADYYELSYDDEDDDEDDEDSSIGSFRPHWLELDNLLMQFWESHSVRVEAVYYSYKAIGPASGRARDYAVGLCMQEGKDIGILTSVG